jgi:hypothetical protein
MKPLELIRTLSGIFVQSEAVNALALINLVVRGMIGDSDREFVSETVLKYARIEIDWS